jgi:uncharacterized membrane protein
VRLVSATTIGSELIWAGLSSTTVETSSSYGLVFFSGWHRVSLALVSGCYPRNPIFYAKVGGFLASGLLKVPDFGRIKVWRKVSRGLLIQIEDSALTRF